MKKAGFGKLLISLMIAIISFPGFGQSFQKLYGTAENEYVSRALPSGNNIYIIGATMKSGQSLYFASVSKLDSFGVLQWTTTADVPSVWSDGIITPSGDLLLVGFANPPGENPALIGSVDASGNFKWLKMYGQERLLKIVLNPVPQYNQYPYYILSNSTISGKGYPTLTMTDGQGNLNSRQIYTSSNYFDYFDDIEVKPNGELLFAGYFTPSSQDITARYGFVYQADNTGNIINGAGAEFKSEFSKVRYSSSGDIYAAGTGNSGTTALIIKFDSDLLLKWQRELSSSFNLSDLWMNANDIFITGNYFTGNKNYNTVTSITESNNSASLNWIRYFDAGSGSTYNGARSCYLPPARILYTDRRNTPGGLGLTDIFVSVSPTDLGSCLTSQFTNILQSASGTFNGPVLPGRVNVTGSPFTSVSSGPVGFSEVSLCPSACDCSFGNLQVNGPGSQVQSLTCGGAPVTLACQPGAGYTVTGSWGPCPTVKSILVDACQTESANEFLLIYSGGKGFNINDLSVDFDVAANISGPQNNDINIGISPCGFQQGNTAMITGCSNVIAAGPGTFIPPGSYLIVQTSASASGGLYNFSNFCNTLQPVYVVRSSCARSADAFPNAGPGTVATAISIAGSCSSSIVYNRALLSGSNGDYFIAPSTYVNNGCTAPPANLLSVNPAIQFSWILSGPAPTQSGTYNGNGPFFSLTLPPAYFTQQGTYTLTLQGTCGNTICPCTVQFNVNCPSLCPCDLQAFEAQVDKGFATSYSSSGCELCFSPLALNGCQTVEWQINPFTGPPIGTSAGNQTFCYTFPGSGTYSVKMSVTQKNADGSICETFSKTQTVIVTCGVMIPTGDPLLKNSSFSENPAEGGLLSGGSATGWTAGAGDPVVIGGLAGSSDGWGIAISGNSSYQDVLSSVDPVCLPKTENGTLSLRIKVWGDPHEGRPNDGWKPSDFKKGGKITIMLNSGSGTGCSGDNCYTLAELYDWPSTESGEWLEVRIPYNLSLWKTTETCGKGSLSVPVRISVSITNPYTDSQDGGHNRSAVLIDYIRFNFLNTAIETVSAPAGVLNIYPNPASGSVTICLPSEGSSATTLRIFNLSGRLVAERSLQAGSSLYNIDISALPAGTYFVHALCEGKLEGIEKLIIK